MKSNTILKKIDNFLESLFENLKENKINVEEFIERLRAEENYESTLLFYFFIERFLLIMLSKGEIFVSKAILKYYLLSEFKEHEDYIFYGVPNGENDEILFSNVVLTKNLFGKLLDALNLKKTKEYYVQYLLSKDEEFRGYASKTVTLNDVIEVLYHEIDEKGINNKVILL